MEPRFETRKQELLNECQTDPEVFRGMLKRLAQFLEPFVQHLWRKENREHAHTFVAGLLSDLDQKNAESIAYRHDQDRQGLQHFIGSAPWDHKPLLDELNRQVAQTLGEDDAVLVFDPSGFQKKGQSSVGVARQWLGRLGKVDNGQVGVFLGYVSRQEHALVDLRLYLPKSWNKDKARRQECGVPKDVRYRTRHALALEMLDERGPQLPHGWVAGDDEMGRPAAFRRELRARNERYLLAVPSNTTIRDLEGEPPAGCGVGRPPKRRFEQVRRWSAALPPEAWTRVEVGLGEKGPLTMEVVKRKVESKTDGRVGAEEVLVVTRTADAQGAVKHDYYLSNADADTPLEEFARVAQAEHRIEQCIQRGKSEAGMADYQTRTWAGWHHHQTLCLLAVWFLILETRRGKKWTPALTVPQIREGLAVLLHAAYQSAQLDRITRERTRRLERNALAKFYHYKARNRWPPKKVA
jgi:SRSO17 transposase